MGEIIDFKTRNAGEALFCKYYEQANSIDRWYIRNTLVLNLYGNDYANSSSFERVKQILGEKETRKIMGYCSAWYATRRPKEKKKYMEELSKIIASYKIEFAGENAAN